MKIAARIHSFVHWTSYSNEITNYPRWHVVTVAEDLRRGEYLVEGFVFCKLCNTQCCTVFSEDSNIYGGRKLLTAPPLFYLGMVTTQEHFGDGVLFLFVGK